MSSAFYANLNRANTPCPEPKKEPVNYEGGVYYFCAPTRLQYSSTPDDRLSVYHVGAGGVERYVNEISSSNTTSILSFMEHGSYVIRWSIPVGGEQPQFQPLPIKHDGYIPYHEVFRNEFEPTTECFNSFTVCIPACCRVTIRTTVLPDITMPMMDRPYCHSFGPFDNLMGNISIVGFENEPDALTTCDDFYIAVQRARRGQPSVTIAPKLDNSSSCSRVEIDFINSINNIEASLNEIV